MEIWSIVTWKHWIVFGVFVLSSPKYVLLKNEEKQRKRIRLDRIMDELNKVDSHIRIFFKPERINDTDLLNDVRDGLEQGFSSINLYLEHNDKLLGFSKEELDKLISVESFVANENITSYQGDENRKNVERKNIATSK